MATDKRARQRANRDAKLAAERKLQRRAKIIKRGRRILIWALVALAGILIVNAISSGSSEEAVGVMLLL